MRAVMRAIAAMKGGRQSMAGGLGMCLAVVGCGTGIGTFGNSFEAVNLNRTAQVHFEYGEYGQAEEALRRSLEADFENPVSHYWLGRVFAARGQRDKAIYEYRLAVRFGPALEIAQLALIEALEQAGQHTESLDAAETYLTQRVMPWRWYRRLAETFRQAGMKDHMVLAYETAGKAYPRNAEPFLALADYYREQGNKDEEIKWLTRAARADPLYPGLARRLGENNLRLEIPRREAPPPRPSEERLRELEL